MNAYLQVLKQPYYEAVNQGTKGFYWMLLCVIVLIDGITAGVTRSVMAAIFMTSVCLAAVAIFWFLKLLKSIVMQNSPANACLVPNINRILRQVLIGIWLVLALAIALFSKFAGKPAELGFALGLPCVIFASMMLRYALVRWIVIPMFCLPALVPGSMPAVRALLAQADQPWCLAALLLAIALGRGVLSRLLPQGGDAHATWHRGFKQVFADLRANAAHDFGSSRNVRLNHLLAWGYNGALARDCRTKAGGQKLLPYALGPQVHWGMALFPPVLLLILWLVFRLIFDADLGVAKVGLFALPGMVFGLMFSLGASDAGFAAVMRKTSVEQALVKLAPATPQGAQLNAALARAILNRFVVAWSATGAAAVLIATAIPYGSDYAYLVYAVTCAFTWPVAFQLRDYARLPGTWSTNLPMFILSCLIFAMIWPLNQLVGANQAAWLTFDVICLVVIAAIIRWRWYSMLRSPVAFPAGRNA